MVYTDPSFPGLSDSAIFFQMSINKGFYPQYRNFGIMKKDLLSSLVSNLTHLMTDSSRAKLRLVVYNRENLFKFEDYTNIIYHFSPLI
jgi:hypothetical protein